MTLYLADSRNAKHFNTRASLLLAFSLAAGGITFPASAQRAPHSPSSTTIDVLNYDIEINVAELAQNPVDAVARVTFEAEERINTVTLHIEPDRIAIDSVRSGAGIPLNYTVAAGISNAWGLSGSTLVVNLPAPLLRGNSAVIEIRYRIAVQSADDPRGFFFDPDFHGSRILNTRNWPYFARYWLPSNDHPSDAATFRFTLNVPRGIRGVANGRLVQSSTAPAGDTHIWEQDEPIPTYAIQVAIGEMSSTEGLLCFDPSTGSRKECSADAARVPVQFVFPGMLPNRPQFESEIRRAEDALAYFSTAFGPYRFDKAGFLNAPHPFSMESASLVTLVTPGDAVHEMLHHWWGNAVQFETWGDFWISEGITTYFTGFFDEVSTGTNTSCATQGRRLNVAPGQDPLDNFNTDAYCIGAAAIADFRTLLAQLGDLDPAAPEATARFLGVFKTLYEEMAFKSTDTRGLVRRLKFASFRTLCERGESVSYESVSTRIDQWEAKWFTGIPGRAPDVRRRPASAPAPRCESQLGARQMLWSSRSPH